MPDNRTDYALEHRIECFLSDHPTTGDDQQEAREALHEIRRRREERIESDARQRQSVMDAKRDAVRRVLALADRERLAPGGHGTATLLDLYPQFIAAISLARVSALSAIAREEERREAVPPSMFTAPIPRSIKATDGAGREYVYELATTPGASSGSRALAIEALARLSAAAGAYHQAVEDGGTEGPSPSEIKRIEECARELLLQLNATGAFLAAVREAARG